MFCLDDVSLPHSLFLSLSVCLCLSLSLSLCCFRAVSLARYQSIARSLSLSVSLSVAFVLSRSLGRSIARSRSLSLSLCLSLSLPLSLSFSLSLSLLLMFLIFSVAEMGSCIFQFAAAIALIRFLRVQRLSSTIQFGKCANIVPSSYFILICSRSLSEPWKQGKCFCLHPRRWLGGHLGRSI